MPRHYLFRSVPICTRSLPSLLLRPTYDCRWSFARSSLIYTIWSAVTSYHPARHLACPCHHSTYSRWSISYTVELPSYSKKYKSKYRLIQKRKEMSLDIGNGLLLITTRFAATAVHALPFPEVKSARKIGTVFKSGARHVQTAQILVSLSNLSPRSTPAARETTWEERTSPASIQNWRSGWLHLRLLERVPEIHSPENAKMAAKWTPIFALFFYWWAPCIKQWRHNWKYRSL